MAHPLPPAGMVAAGLLAGLAACGPQAGAEVTEAPFAPEYLGGAAAVLDGDLIEVKVAMKGARDGADIDAYTRCVAAKYTVGKGYGFLRHVRTNVDEKGGVRRADAVYTISPDLPRGSMTIDAEVALAECAERKIPTV